MSKGSTGAFIETMRHPWRSTEENIKPCAQAVSKRPSGAMSHHDASATATRGQREQHENPEAARSYSYVFIPPHSTLRSLRVLLPVIVLVLFWSSLLGVAAAQQSHEDRHLSSRDVNQARKGPSLLVLDTRPPPAVPWNSPSKEEYEVREQQKAVMHLYQRQDEDKATATTSGLTPRSSLATDPNSTPTDFAVPQPFDTALSNNFTASCAAFWTRLLTDNDFKNCHPFSLMLQTSSGLFDASKSFVRITQTLEATCSVNMTTCTGTMDGMARALIANDACAVDYANDNPQVLQAYNGLVAYAPLYQASCLRDDQGSYCYANAVTNTSATADSYPYYLPLGQPLVGGARPTCNSCLQDAMAIFSSFAGNTTQPISKTYNGAAALIQIPCGTGFVNQTATPLKGAASATTASLTPSITLILMLFIYLLQ